MSSGATPARDAPVLLTYRTLGIGDLLTAVPALRALRAGFPTHRHVLAAPDHLAPLVETIEAVDDHLRVDELAPLPDGLVPDIAVNLHGSGPESHRILLAARPGRLLAFAHPDVPQSHAGPRWSLQEHEVARWCRLLAAAGVPADENHLELAPPPGSAPAVARGATLVHPGAKAAARRWPLGRFAAVARRELEGGRRVVVTGSEAERARVTALARAVGLGADAVLVGCDLGALARAVAVAGRVVCGDTGVAHLATAYGTPSVLLFGPSAPSRWGPPLDRRDRHRVLWAGRTGDPLGDRVDAGLLEIPVTRVLAELAALESARPTAVGGRS